MKNKFLDLLANQKNPIVFDGAMGTVLHNRGESFEGSFEELNLSKPALIADIHREYIEAGAQVIMTNTFGANRFKLAENGLEDKLEEINCAAVQLAKKVVDASFKEVLVAGDVGPLGVRLAPFGRVKPEQARKAFAEQIISLANCDVDLIIIETISDLYEAEEAVKATKENTDLPVIVSMTYTRDDRTLLGNSPENVAEKMHQAGADILGINCSGGPAQILRILKRMRKAVPEAKFSVMPNAGWPERVSGRIMYPAGPEYFGEYALAFRHAGACVVGGCCGTTPTHIESMKTALENTPAENYKDSYQIRVLQKDSPRTSNEKKSQLAKKFNSGKFVISVEMDPPRGLSIHKIQAGAGLMAEVGADVINVADSPMARMRMSPWAVCDLIQRDVGIETTLHFPTRGRNLLRVQGDLLAAHAIGIRNIFVVMGDPTEIGDYPDAMDDYDLVPSGLIRLIKQGFNAGVDHAGVEIGDPTNFFVGSALNLAPRNPEREIKIIQRKIENGTDFFLTQPVFEPEKAKEFLDLFAERQGPLEKPLLVGVLPLYNSRHANFLHNEVPGIHIPKTDLERIKSAGEDSAKEGVQMAIELISKIKEWGQGIYLMPPFGRFDMGAEIIEVVRKK